MHAMPAPMGESVRYCTSSAIISLRRSMVSQTTHRSGLSRSAPPLPCCPEELFYLNPTPRPCLSRARRLQPAHFFQRELNRFTVEVPK